LNKTKCIYDRMSVTLFVDNQGRGIVMHSSVCFSHLHWKSMVITGKMPVMSLLAEEQFVENWLWTKYYSSVEEVLRWFLVEKQMITGS